MAPDTDLMEKVAEMQRGYEERITRQSGIIGRMADMVNALEIERDALLLEKEAHVCDHCRDCQDHETCNG